MPQFEQRKAIRARTGDHPISEPSAWSGFILDAASGFSPAALAHKYGLTSLKVERMLRNPEVQAQLAACVKRLSKIGDYARNKLMASAPELIDAQLEVALGRDYEMDDNDTILMGEDGRPVMKWKYGTQERMQAGRYCLDKILPTITKVEETHTTVPSEAILSIRDSLAALATLPRPSILNSPSVYEGRAALPQAIDVEAVQK